VVVTTSDNRVSGSLAFDYDEPEISVITPESLTTSGGDIVITGSNFGTNALGDATVTVGGEDCAVNPAQHTHSLLRCSVPAGQGVSLQVVVTVAGQDSNVRFFGYSNPVVDSISPSQGPTSGQFTLTLTGSSFGLVGGSVQVGSSDCSITLQEHTMVKCTASSGEGSNDVVYTLGTQISNVVTFTYAPPEIVSVSPPSAPTSGNSNLVIFGNNFGDNTPLVQIGGIACVVDTARTNHTHIVCKAPAGQGANLDVFVFVGEQSATLSGFSYLPPSIDSVTTADADTSGGLLTVTGDNFGLSGIVTVDGLPCTNDNTMARSHTVIECSFPAGAGLNVPVVVTVLGRPSDSFPFSYNIPVLDRVSPNAGPTLGGTVLTLTGSNFGPSGTVMVGDSRCFNTGAGYGDTVIECALPRGQGQDILVVVTSASGFSLEDDLQHIDYDPPTFGNAVPSNGPTSGDIPVKFTGSNFGTAATVTVDGNACDVTFQTHAEIICNLPAGSGSNLQVVIAVGGQIVTTANVFSYDAPQLAALSPSSGGTGGNTVAVLTGSSFMDVAGVVTVGGTPVTIQSWDHGRVTFLTPAGTGPDNVVELTTSLGQSATGLTFDYGSPEISTISPTEAGTGRAVSHLPV
jgi:hypothetical protein